MNEVEATHDELIYVHGQMPLHQVLEKQAKERPSDVAIVWYGREIQYRELADWVNRFAWLLLTNGVQKGDRVALYLHTCPQYFIAHYAIQKIGAIVGPCSPSFKSLELAYQVQDMGAKVIVTSYALYPNVAEVRDDLEIDHVVVTDYADLLPREGQHRWRVPEDFFGKRIPTSHVIDLFTAIRSIPHGFPEIEQNVDLDDICLLVYTSGTTGRPKGAMLTYRNALFKTAASAQANDVRQTDRLLSILPLCHIAGMLMGLTIPLYSGSPVVLMYRFDPVAVLEAIQNYRCTWWYSTAPMNVALMQVPNGRNFDLTSLRTNLCTSFGIQLTEELASRWQEFSRGCPIYEAAYGLSETHTADTYMPAQRVKWGTQGRPIYQTDIRIVDPETKESVPQGELGEIVVKNPGVFRGYWRNQEATESTLCDGWVYTGDIGKLDEDGYLIYAGRLKEMIKVSGFSVFPEDVEALLILHSAIAGATVIGIPDEKRGEVVKAFVVKSTTNTAAVSTEDLMEWAQTHMASYKVPRVIEFVDVLPVSSTGKVMRRLLRKEQVD